MIDYYIKSCIDRSESQPKPIQSLETFLKKSQNEIIYAKIIYDVIERKKIENQKEKRVKISDYFSKLEEKEKENYLNSLDKESLEYVKMLGEDLALQVEWRAISNTKELRQKLFKSLRCHGELLVIDYFPDVKYSQRFDLISKLIPAQQKEIEKCY